MHCHREFFFFTQHMAKVLGTLAGVKKADVLFLCWILLYMVKKGLAQVVLVQIVTQRPQTSEECTQITIFKAVFFTTQSICCV